MKRCTVLLPAITTITLVAWVASSASAEIIDFESVANAQSNPTFTQLDQGVYRFTATHMHAIGTATSTTHAQNGSQVTLTNEGGATYGSSITIRRVDGQPFTLTSFDGAEAWNPPLASFPNASAIRVDAIFASGQMTSQTFALDGIIDGFGGLPDFQTFVLPGFTGITSASLFGVNAAGALFYAFDLDNFVVSDQPCVADYGNGCPGAGGFVPVLDAPVCAASAMAFVLTIQSAPGNAQALLVFGTQEGSQPLGLSGCTLLVQPVLPLLVLIPLSGSGPGNGSAAIGGNIPPGYSGLEFTVQAMVSDPTADLGFLTTNGLHVVIQ